MTLNCQYASFTARVRSNSFFYHDGKLIKHTPEPISIVITIQITPYVKMSDVCDAQQCVIRTSILSLTFS